MSWNPFSRHSAGKKSVVSRHEEREIEREIKKLDELDEATKKIYKDAKRCIETNNGLAKLERKLVTDLAGSGVCQGEEQFQRKVEMWEKSLDDLDRHRHELNTNIQKTVVEPMKKFSSVFPAVQSAIKKRDQSLQEYTRSQVKFDKYQERERTGQNLVKRDLNKKALDAAKDDFTSQNQALRQDLPQLYEGRIDYFAPSFDALMRSQLSYNTEAHRVYSEVASELFHDSKLSEAERKQRINQTLVEIRGLSITVDD